MNVVAVRNEPIFKPIIGPSITPAPRAVFMSGDFPAVSTISASAPVVHATHGGLLHELRYYVGAALAGSVICGLALGWLGHRELIQIAGAVAGLLTYAVTPHRDE